ncbi:MAG: hypothetical protein LBB26_04635, partial [Puniceicoccales bacterium]|nr:hypothetical protein [Puniceicoccales bacterium]
MCLCGSGKKNIKI